MRADGEGEWMSEVLWRFAVRLWRDKPVERICLRLQDECGVPVAALLVALWLAEQGRAPDPALGRRLRSHADQFEDLYLRPLRVVRRRAAQGPGTRELKRQIQEAELEGERLLLEQLGQLAGVLPETAPQSALRWLQTVMQENTANDDPSRALLSALADAASAGRT